MTLTLPPGTRLGKPGEVIAHGTADPPLRKPAQFARTWDEVAAAIELSAETGRLAVTPAPYGKPGGPGLYGVHGLKHSDYLENIVKALMRKGMDKGKATAIARGSIRKWMAKSKHPEVRAAAAGAEAEELKAQARAHAHAATWDDVGGRIELAAAPRRGWDGVALELAAAIGLAANPGQSRVAAGSAGAGQFGSGGGAATAKPAPAGQQKQTPAQAKQNLLNQAGVGKTVSAASNATSAQSGSTTSTAGSTTASSAPATASSTTPAASSTPAAAAATPAAAATTAAITQLQGQVKVWQGQVTTLVAQATALTTMANKIGG